MYTVFAWSVGGAAVHILPPSTLDFHSYDARRAASFAEPEVAPGRAANVGFVREL